MNRDFVGEEGQRVAVQKVTDVSSRATHLVSAVSIPAAAQGPVDILQSPLSVILTCLLDSFPASGRHRRPLYIKEGRSSQFYPCCNRDRYTGTCFVSWRSERVGRRRLHAPTGFGKRRNGFESYTLSRPIFSSLSWGSPGGWGVLLTCCG